MIGSDVLKAKIIDEEAKAFMKMLKANKYMIMGQMSKTRAYISLLSPLLSSVPKHETLLKVLTEAQVLKEISAKQVEEVAGYSLIRYPLLRMRYQLEGIGMLEHCTSSTSAKVSSWYK